jgi:hypothetical protein
MRVGDSITLPRRRASEFGWPGERVRVGLIALWVKDRQKGTLGTAGNGRNSVAPDLRLSSRSTQAKEIVNRSGAGDMGIGFILLSPISCKSDTLHTYFFMFSLLPVPLVFGTPYPMITS